MPGPTAIADVSASLVAYLEDSLSGVVSARSIVLGAPDDTPTKEPVLSIELVDVFENPHLRNGAWTDGDPDPVVDPNALTLDLRYRLTVHPAHGGGSDPTQRTLGRHELLGHVMHLLSEGALLDDPHLQGTLADGVPLQVTYDQQDRTPDHAELTMETPALHYLVTPVIIDPREDQVDEPGINDGFRGRIPRLPDIQERIPKIRLPQGIRKPGGNTDIDNRTRSATDPHRNRDQ